MSATQLTKPVSKLDTEGDSIPGEVQVSFLHWISKNAVAGDDLLVTDAYGDTIWEEVADGPNFSRIHVIKHIIKGLTLSVKDSGTVYVIKGSSYGYPI